MDSSPLPENIDSETENGVEETQEEIAQCDRKGKRKACSGGSSRPSVKKAFKHEIRRLGTVHKNRGRP